MLYKLEPEVAGGWGDNTIVTNRAQLQAGLEIIPAVSYLHYVFDGWEGDELLTSTPCFIVSEGLAESIKGAGLTGYRFDPVEIGSSETFQELYPDTELPRSERLSPLGGIKINKDNLGFDWTGQDFSLSDQVMLVVTDTCLQVMRRHNLQNCRIKELQLL